MHCSGANIAVENKNVGNNEMPAKECWLKSGRWMPIFSQPPRNYYRLVHGLPKSRSPPCPSHPRRQLPAEPGRAPGGFLTVWHHLLGLPGTRSGLRERRLPRLCPCWLCRRAGEPKTPESFRLGRTDRVTEPSRRPSAAVLNRVPHPPSFGTAPGMPILRFPGQPVPILTTLPGKRVPGTQSGEPLQEAGHSRSPAGQPPGRTRLRSLGSRCPAPAPAEPWGQRDRQAIGTCSAWDPRLAGTGLEREHGMMDRP